MGDCFLFLKNEFPDIYSNAQYCEISLVDNYYEISLICAGMCCEQIVSLMCNDILRDNELNPRATQIDKLNELRNLNVIPPEILHKFHVIRQLRNKAVHDEIITDIVNNAEKTHHFLFDICKWFYTSYNGFDLDILSYNGPIYISDGSDIDEKFNDLKPILEDYIKNATNETLDDIRNTSNQVIQNIDNYFKQSLNDFKSDVKGIVDDYLNEIVTNKKEVLTEEEVFSKNYSFNNNFSNKSSTKFRDLSYESEILKEKNNHEIINSVDENKTDDFKIQNSSIYSRKYFNKLANEIQSNPDFISVRKLSQHDENDFIEITEDFDKIKEKADLIYNGKWLENEDKKRAIKFYDSLKNNELFTHDYYPYRRQCILFKNKLKDSQKDLYTIIELFNQEIYCNPHQYVWFHNKLLELIDKLNIGDSEIEKIENLLKNYGENEERYFELQNNSIPIAERIIINDNEFNLLSQEKYDFLQDIYYIKELGVGYIRRKEYETAITYYLNLLQSDILYYKYHAYKQLGRIYAEMKNPNEFKRLYEKLFKDSKKQLDTNYFNSVDFDL